MDLRDEVAEWIRSNCRMRGAMTPEYLADRILAIPEIADALEIMRALKTPGAITIKAGPPLIDPATFNR